MTAPSAAPTFSDSGVVRLEGHMADDVAATSGPKPGAVLQATADELWIKGHRGDLRLPRQSIARIDRGGLYPWFFKGIRVRHSLPGAPAKVQFLPFECDTGVLLRRLHALGYPRG